MQRLLPNIDDILRQESSLSGQICQVLVRPKANQQVQPFLKRHYPGTKYIIVADENTAPLTSFSPDIILPGDSKAYIETARNLAIQAKNAELMIAIGSGTVNDLVKYAAHLQHIPYITIGTAPSMNGYASGNASLIENGIKTSFAAKPPVAIFLDTEILAAAPMRLIQSGFGDVICRSTAQADWLLSHIMKGTEYQVKVFDWQFSRENRLLEHSTKLLKRDIQAVQILAEWLVISGLAMLICNGSYPASQGEHAIAHVMETLHDTSTYHGEQIAVTTLTMAEIQEQCLAQLSPDIKKQIQAVMRNPFVLRAALEHAGCPTTPKMLGWDESLYKTAIAQAKDLRNRFGFLNLE